MLICPSRPHFAATNTCATLRPSPVALIKTLRTAALNLRLQTVARMGRPPLAGPSCAPAASQPKDSGHSTALAVAFTFSHPRTLYSITSFHEAMLDAVLSASRRGEWLGFAAQHTALHVPLKWSRLVGAQLHVPDSIHAPLHVRFIHAGHFLAHERNREAHHVCAVANLTSHKVTRPRTHPHTATVQRCALFTTWDLTDSVHL